MLDEPIDPDDRPEWLVEQGRVDEAITILEARASGGGRLDVERLTDLLMEDGRVEEAEAHWRAAIGAGLPRAYGGLATLLADAGRTDEAIAGWRAARGYAALHEQPCHQLASSRRQSATTQAACLAGA
ncbi:hypothetical protein AB0L34_24600 [Micromonospora sp. NPDC052213]|uniref:hypothetical protein n=1 Tax=Micromonospora sp. NPDC052213 TaxID=3155812 RepID=UPI00342E57EF